VIDAAKAAVEKECPGIVSCADILAFAARDASYILSNEKIYYDVPAGRYDGRESFADETDQLPGPGSSVQDLKKSFAAQGLSLADAVTLSGAHSIGLARCLFFKDRLSAMDPGYAATLNATCNAGGDSYKVDQDYKSPDVLDNQYYKNIDKFVLFASDAALKSSETIDQVNANAGGYGKWEKDFGDAMVKMGKIGVITSPGYGAEIRKVCSQINY
jgi:peroxidase